MNDHQPVGDARSNRGIGPVVLAILDGWGHREELADNAIAGARKPVFDRLWAECPHALLQTSGADVGLPDGQMGNSEVGHLNIGAGRLVLQELARVNDAVAKGTLPDHPVMRRLVDALRRSGGICHLLGLISPGGVHSHQDHAVAIAKLLGEAGIPTALHVITDGRDTPPRSALDHIQEVSVSLPPTTRIATVSGRYYAMDRDNRWERVETAYQTIVEASGPRAGSALEAIQKSYAADTSDEFVLPVAIGDYGGMSDADALLCFNFRPDRVREILSAILDPDFSRFVRRRFVRLSDAVGMVQYSSHLNTFLEPLFPPQHFPNVLGEVVSSHKLTQLRLAETEKYPHVTYFLNGGREEPYTGEERIMVPSPKIATYDLQPEMSAPRVTDEAVNAVISGKFDLVVLNFANPDMVGHTGDYGAAVKAIEVVDAALGRLEVAVRQTSGAMLITADHGNCETMRDPQTGQAHTAHTTGPVPVVVVGRSNTSLMNGRLSDVAPTILELMNLPQPAEMTGTSLLRGAK